ncbi:FEKKY domain-containing protein [Rufibacter immobilis]|uniref:FEKKY domain-containing protein n=1 Tax=Rufibacter immobilis TaxID=1348778 RepID=UPI0035E58520
MKQLFLILVFVADIPICKAAEKNITAQVVFENLTENTSITGKFLIKELNKVIEVHSMESFKVILPEKGKYSFGFYAENAEASTTYPNRITSGKHTILVKLTKKDNNTKPLTTNTIFINKAQPFELSNTALEEMLQLGKLNFIFHGIQEVIADFSIFKEKYGIGYNTQNCIIDPATYKRTTAHNQRIERYLTEQYGVAWKNDLPAKPFGIK